MFEFTKKAKDFLNGDIMKSLELSCTRKRMVLPPEEIKQAVGYLQELKDEAWKANYENQALGIEDFIKELSKDEEEIDKDLKIEKFQGKVYAFRRVVERITESLAKVGSD